MKFAKIQFASADDRIRAVGELMHRAKVVVLRDGIFILPEGAIEALTTKGISYTVLQWLNQDDVHQALRDTVAHPV